jgi:hypothetical protein
MTMHGQNRFKLFIFVEAKITEIWNFKELDLDEIIHNSVSWRSLRHQITDRQHIGYNIPQAVLHSLLLLKMGKIVARNLSSQFGFINKP